MMTTRARALLAAVTAAALIGSCGDPTGPGTGLGQLSFAPVFASALEASIVNVAFVRVRISQPLSTTALIDSVFTWPATGDSLVIRLALPVTEEPYALRLAMANAQGDTVFRAGPIPVRASLDPNPANTASPVLTYTGVGANASGVRFVSPPTTASFGQTVPIVAEAFDGLSAPIAGTPIAFSLVSAADSLRARFPNRGVGSLVAGNVRGNVAIEARLLTGASVTTTIAVQPVANGMVVQSGNNQTGNAGAALAQPLVARVRAADGLGVAGVPVTFTVLTGGGTLAALTDTSDANGDVSTTMTLGTGAGAQTVRVAVPSVPAAEVTFSATAIADAATRLVILDEPTNGTAGAVIAPVVRVAIQDAGGNTLTTATTTVAVAILNNPGGLGTLQGPASVNAVAGIATFNALRIDQVAVGYTLRFTSGVLTSDTSAAFNVQPGAAAALAFVTQPPLAVVSGAPFGTAVRARDAFGNTQPSFSGNVTIGIGTNPSAGALAGTTTVAAVAGVATFSALSITNVGTGYTLVANSGGLTAATSNTLDITVPAGINAWVNPVGGNWSTAANWSLGIVPTATDTVWIRQSGTYTVNADQNVTLGRVLLGAATGAQTLSLAANTLTMAESVFVAPTGIVSMSGGNLVGPGTLQVSGAFNWSSGNISGVGGAVRILAGATTTISSTLGRNLQDRLVEILGTATVTGAAAINTGQGAIIRVAPTGTMTIQADAAFLFNLGGAATLLHNQGTLRRNTTAGVATIGMAVDNDGVMELVTGTLRLTGGSDVQTWSGSATVPAGTTLDFASGIFALGAGSGVTGAGALTNSGATVTVAAPWAYTGALTISSGAFNYSAPSGSIATVALSGGALGGAAGSSLTTPTAFAWSGTSTINTSGTLSIPVASTLTVADAGTKTLQNTLLLIGGTANFASAVAFNTGQGAILRVLAGATMTISGAPSILYNLGGTQSAVENLGSIIKNTSAGTAVFGTSFVNSGAITVATGTLDLTGASTLGGTVSLAAATTLRLNGGTATLQPTFVVSGLGETLVNAGTVNGLVVGDTANFARLRLLGGSITTGGVMRATDHLEWAGGAALNGVGVLVAVDTMLVTGTTARQLSGGGSIETYGVTLWASNAVINTGQGARWRNMPTGDMTWSGDGSFLSNQGGPIATLENRGALRFTGTGTTTITAALQDTVGVLFNIASGTVSAGGGGRLAGIKTVNGFLDVTAGTLTMSSATSIASTTGALRIAGGTVTPDSGASVSIARLELSSGLLDHEATVTIGSLFNWSGGNIQSNIVGLGGTTTLNSGATLNISGTAARSAGGTHTLDLLAGSTTTHTATGNVATGNGFIIRNSGAFDLQGAGGFPFTLGGTQPTFRNLTGATLTSSGVTTGAIAMRLDNPGGALAVTGDTLRLLLGGTGSLTGTATVTTAALKLGGGTFTMTGALTVAGTSGDLVIDNGSLVIGAQTLTVNGDLLTQNGGSVTSAASTAVIDVNGNAQFNGGQSVLSAGELRVAGNFQQGPIGNTNAFDASGSHRTLLDGAATQNITFAQPTTSRFNRLQIGTANRAVSMQTNATVLDSLIMFGGGAASDLIGAGTTQRLTVNGVIRLTQSTLSPRLAVPVVEVSVSPSVDPIGAAGRGFTPDTAVFLGAAITALPTGTGYQYKSVRLSTGAGVTISSDTIQGDLHTTSSLASYVGSVTHLIQGKLRTTGTGAIFLFSVDANVAVSDSAIFSGASTNGSLNAGTLTLRGHFVQAGGNAAAYSATGTHNTIFAGTALQTIRFDNPGTLTTNSHFARFTVGNASAAGIRILSPVHAVTQLGSTFARPALSLVSSTNGDSLSAAGVQADSITFDNVPVRFVAGGTLTTFNVIRFQNMDPAATQFRITRAGPTSSFNFNLVDFLSTPTTGFYFSFTNTAVGTALPFAFSNTTPLTIAALSNRYQRLGPTPPAVTWNGQTMP